MIKIQRVNENTQTGDPKSHGYNAYDFDDIPDKYARASIFGKVVQTKKTETRTWTANTNSDPYKPTTGTRKLRTEDYGNYVKLRGEVDGQIVYEISSHHKPETLTVKVGNEIKVGQILAEIGKTGNVRSVGSGDGSHEHKEFRNSENKTIPVEFTTESQGTNMEQLPKDSIIRDFYKAVKEEFSDDEVNRWLQENKNLYEIFTSVLEGDGMARNHLLKLWGLEIDTNKDKLIEQQRETILSTKEILRRVGLEAGQDSEAMLSKLEWVVDKYQELKDKQIPCTIIKNDGKDYKLLFKLWEVLVAIEKRGEENGKS